MKTYDKYQFKKMVKRYHKEYGKAEINSWSDYYQTMKATLCEIKSNNKLDEEKAETEIIIQYCNQYSDNQNMKTSISVASFVYSVIAIIITMFSESKPEIFGEEINSLTLFITVSVLIILITVLMSFKSSRKLKADAIYYKTKLNLIEEITSK